MSAQACVDCGSTTRKLSRPGPRCATHQREHKRRLSDQRHERWVQKTYGLQPGEYTRMYYRQGGVCYLCQRATGKTKRLAVDHDHKTGKVRGLLCGPCNRMVGHARDDPEFFRRGVLYLGGDPCAQ